MSYLGTKENARADQSSVELDKSMESSPMRSGGSSPGPSNKAASGELTTRRTTLKAAHSGGGVVRQNK